MKKPWLITQGSSISLFNLLSIDVSTNIRQEARIQHHECAKKDCHQKSKVLREVYSPIQYLTKPVAQVTHLKIPINFEGIPFKLQRLYTKYLDCKAQTIEGVFHNTFSRSKNPKDREYYRRVMKELVRVGWASQEQSGISLRAYQHVWRDLAIERLRKRDVTRFEDKGRKSSGQFFGYFKISIDELPQHRKTTKDKETGKVQIGYSDQIQEKIFTELAKRRRAQMRWTLKKRGVFTKEARFACISAATLFGYRSASTGSKLRKSFFSVIDSEDKPYFNQINGRWEDPVKRIAL